MKKKLLAFLMCGLVLGGCAIPNVYAASAGVSLFTDETTDQTAWIGNSSGHFRVVGAVNSISAYSVEFDLVGAATSNSTGGVLKSSSVLPGDNLDYTKYNVSSSYSVGQVILYGNNKNNPKKNCIASTFISNE